MKMINRLATGEYDWGLAYRIDLMSKKAQESSAHEAMVACQKKYEKKNIVLNCVYNKADVHGI